MLCINGIKQLRYLKQPVITKRHNAKTNPEKNTSYSAVVVVVLEELPGWGQQAVQELSSQTALC